MASEIIAHAWFSGITCIGVIVTFNGEDEKPYIGRIHTVTGADEANDLQSIKDWGSEIDSIIAAAIIDKYGIWTTSNIFHRWILTHRT